MDSLSDSFNFQLDILFFSNIYLNETFLFPVPERPSHITMRQTHGAAGRRDRYNLMEMASETTTLFLYKDMKMIVAILMLPLQLKDYKLLFT